jgi:uncharacterized membrane protein YfcA
MPAGVNAVAACPPASYIGARITAKYVKGSTLKKVFASLIVAMTVYRLLRFFV